MRPEKAQIADRIDFQQGIFDSEISPKIGNILSISADERAKISKAARTDSSSETSQQKTPQNMEELIKTANEAIQKAAEVMRRKRTFSSSWEIAVHIMSLSSINPGDENDASIIREWASQLIDARNSEGVWFSSYDWQTQASNVYDTSFAVVALIKSGENPNSEIISNAIDFIERMNISSYGGWPAKRDEELDVGATSWAIIALKKVPYSKSFIIQRGIEWLRLNQHQDGGWGQHYDNVSDRRPSLIAKTSDAVAALLAYGEDPQISPEIKDAVSWLIRLHNVQKDKSIDKWAWSWGKDEKIVAHDVENTSCAVAILLKCTGNLDSSVGNLNLKIVQLSIIWLLERQNSDGTWEDDPKWNSSITPRVVMCLKNYVMLWKSREI